MGRGEGEIYRWAGKCVALLLRDVLILYLVQAGRRFYGVAHDKYLREVEQN